MNCSKNMSEKNSHLTIKLVGDIAPLGSYNYLLEEKEHDADLIIGNAEVPFCNISTKTQKCGANLAGNFMGFSNNISPCYILSLANNHTMDFGLIGLLETKSNLCSCGAAVLGAGNTLTEASAPLIIQKCGYTVGILARCETQFGIATLNKAGVAPLSPAIYQDVQNLCKKVDLLIVSIHGAAEMCPWPSPEWQQFMRSLIDAGADIVHGHHSHIPQGYELYKGKFIFYGLGNFVVNPDRWKSTPNTLWSLTPIIKFNRSIIECDMQTSVVKQNGENVKVTPASVLEFNNHSNFLEKCCRPLSNWKLLTGLWQEFSVREYHRVYARWLDFPEGQKVEVKLTSRQRFHALYSGLRNAIRGNKYVTIKSTKQQLLTRYHLFACESHHSALKSALGVLSGELDDLRTHETKLLADQMMPWSMIG